MIETARARQNRPKIISEEKRKRTKTLQRAVSGDQWPTRKGGSEGVVLAKNAPKGKERDWTPRKIKKKAPQV